MRDLLLELAVEPEIVRAMRVAAHLAAASADAATDDTALLIWAVDDDDPVTAIGALHALGGVRHPDADRALTAALHDQRGWIREHAAWVLAARRPQADALVPLTDLLSGDSSLTAMVAQRTLVSWGAHRPEAVAAALRRRFNVITDSTARRRIVETLGGVATSDTPGLLCRLVDDPFEHQAVRATAAGALADHRSAEVDRVLRSWVDDASPVGTAALLSLDGPPPRPRSPGGALRIGQVSLTGELDGVLARAGTGDTGGVASLLVGLSDAFGRHDDVEAVLTIGRSTPDGELTSLLLPDSASEAFAMVSIGTGEPMVPLADAWDHRLPLERSIRRALSNRPALDVLHLRMADVGTLAAASVARRLGVPVAFTCAPDPHGSIESRQQLGTLDRDSFGAVDQDEHLWFRARMVERLVVQADRLVLLPRRDAVARVRRLVGVDRARLDRDAVVAPEGIDLRAIDRALDAVGRGCSSIGDELIDRIAPERHVLPLVVSVGRLHPVKGVDRIVTDWLADAEVAETTNLVIVGGDLDTPTRTEAGLLRRIDDRCRDDANGAAVILLGARPRAAAAEIMAVAAIGYRDVIAPGGAYVNGSAKEEFGLALLEALATGLPVVAPQEGGPSTYVTVDGGVLVEAGDPLAPAIRRALALNGRAGRAERVRAMIEQCYTIDAYADALVRAYEPVMVAVDERPGGPLMDVL